MEATGSCDEVDEVVRCTFESMRSWFEASWIPRAGPAIHTQNQHVMNQKPTRHGQIRLLMLESPLCPKTPAFSFTLRTPYSNSNMFFLQSNPS